MGSGYCRLHVLCSGPYSAFLHGIHKQMKPRSVWAEFTPVDWWVATHKIDYGSSSKKLISCEFCASFGVNDLPLTGTKKKLVEVFVN